MKRGGRDRALRLYRCLLRLLPRSMLHEYGEDMQSHIAERLRAADTVWRRLGVWWLAFRDVIGVAVTERIGGSNRRHPSGEHRDTSRSLAGLGLDIRYSIRSLLHAPAYTIAVVVTLGVGTGALTSLFAVVNGVLLKPLPYRDSDRLTVVNSPFLTRDNVDAWIAQQTAADTVVAFATEVATVQTPDGAVLADVLSIGTGLLDLIGWVPTDGRSLSRADHSAGGAPVVMVSERFRREYLGGSAVPGSTLRMNERAYEVIGVLPHDEFLNQREIDVFLPLQHADARGMSLLARIARATSIDDARQRLLPLAERLATPEQRRQLQGIRASIIDVRSIGDVIVGDVRRTLWLLFGAALIVLLLSALNVANLASGRAHARSGEFAMRTALGAGRMRLVRQLTVEAALLGTGGAALGVLLALVTPGLLSLAPEFLPRSGEVVIDALVIACAVTAALTSVLIFCVGPGFWIARRSERNSLRAVVERTRRGRAAQNTLVVVEIAVALVLVVGVALLARTYAALRPTDPGFRIEDRVVASFNLPRPRYADPTAAYRFTSELTAQLEQRLSARIALTTDLPLTGMSMVRQASRGAGNIEKVNVHYRAVSPDYLELMEMRLVAGRVLNSMDARDGLTSVVLNETAARSLWGVVNVLGRRTTVEMRDGSVVDVEVVGVLHDAWAFRGPDPAAEMFVPFQRTPFGRFHVVIESTRGRPVRERDVMAAVQSVDPTVPLQNFASMRELVAWTTTVPRFQAALLGALSGIALLLAATGCFAVLSQMVALRTPEMGIRMALGASSPAIARLVLGRIALLAASGISIGTLVALGATRILESEIYGVTSFDPGSYLVSSALLATTVLLAGARPLWRALRVDPLQSLRKD